MDGSIAQTLAYIVYHALLSLIKNRYSLLLESRTVCYHWLPPGMPTIIVRMFIYNNLKKYYIPSSDSFSHVA
ncbi:hypothetical protein DK880_00083 [Candidatus Cardinium hertigii]|uniref:Uncharacterized protein n=1 Tax=Candidatus Cardinium hertigii TaxID=247481 RepID=A0A2Z3L7I7_9BACT|nr:hypothetical protein DK880_00083 [Candidatus Cardinium hertigii]